MKSPAWRVLPAIVLAYLALEPLFSPSPEEAEFLDQFQPYGSWVVPIGVLVALGVVSGLMGSAWQVRAALLAGSLLAAFAVLFPAFRMPDQTTQRSLAMFPPDGSRGVELGTIIAEVAMAVLLTVLWWVFAYVDSREGDSAA